MKINNFIVETRVKIYIVFFVAFSTVITGCKRTEANVELLNTRSYNTSDKFYSYLMNDQISNAINLFSQDVIETYSQNELMLFLDEIKNENGNIDSFSRLKFKYTLRSNKDSEVLYITNIYKVYYSRGKIAKEIFIYEVEQDKNILMKIDRYETEDYE